MRTNRNCFWYVAIEVFVFLFLLVVAIHTRVINLVMDDVEDLCDLVIGQYAL